MPRRSARLSDYLGAPEPAPRLSGPPRPWLDATSAVLRLRGLQISRPCSALVLSIRMTMGALSRRGRALRRSRWAFPGPGNTTKDIDQDGPHLGVRVDDLQGIGHDFRVGATPDIQEIRRFAAHLVTTLRVLMARPAPFAMMPTVPSSPIYCNPLSRAIRSRGSTPRESVLGPFRVSELGVFVQADLGVQGVDATLGGEDGPVDLDDMASPSTNSGTA